MSKGALTKDDIQAQSERAYKQWAPQWREHAKIHSKYPMKNLDVFENSGIGKAALCVANGYSLEEEIETIKKYQHNVDIICCDKSLRHLIANGIRPKFCLVADANVSYDKYLADIKDELQDTILIANVCANPTWTEKGNWKDRYFFCVMDVLESQKEWQAISGCPNVIPAGTNVSNSLVIFLTQCDNSGRKNFFAYDKILLIGFDYSWRANGSYYAFDKDGNGKSNYMRHTYLMDMARNQVCSSNNLIFSARWLDQYVNAFKLPVVQCTRSTVLGSKYMGVLAEQMQYSFRQEDSAKVREMVSMRKMLVAKKKEIEETIHKLAKEHYYSFVASV